MSFFDWLKRVFGSTSKTTPNEYEPLDEEIDEAKIQREMDLSQKVLAQMKEKTIKPLLRLKLTDESVSLTGNKVGGLPYIPSKEAVPFDAKGMPLQMLAQINCAELSHLPDFPQTGLLQFWIGQDGSFGLFDDKGFRVVWYETIDEEISEADVRSWFAELPQPEKKYSPVDGEFGLAYENDNEAMPLSDAHFNPIFTPLYNALAGENTIEDRFELTGEANEMIWDSISGDGHKIGGYPTFCQEDPREEDSDKTVLLLQIDSDYDGERNKTIWGDGGVCNFFCTPDELKRRDFSNVLYNWDCN
ncbi:MAG: DUF1963 domain-containing protein [Paludibacteraceae bacterium]|nr:DUF1963 domain-containing protein [Paludibacteraceae bacterium]